MSDPKTFIHFRIPKTVRISDQALRPGEDSTSDEQAGATRSGNVQSRSSSLSVQPLRRINTKQAPRLASFSVANSPARGSETPKSAISSTERSALRASIAHLESLIHEAARLVDTTIPHEERENRPTKEQTSNIKFVEDDQSKMDLQPPEKDSRETTQAKLPTLGSPQWRGRAIKNHPSLPHIKSTAASPLLTLSFDDDNKRSWTPTSACSDHAGRLDDIQEHMHDAVCPSSRHNSVAVPVAGRENDLSSTPSLEVEPPTPLEAPPKLQTDSPSKSRVRFNEADLKVPERTSSNNNHKKWRKPSMAPPGFIFKHEEPSYEEISPDTATPPLAEHTEPMPAEDNTTPAVRVNGVEVSDWDAILADPRHPPKRVKTGHERHFSNFFGVRAREPSVAINLPERTLQPPKIDLRRKSYVDVYHEGQIFDVQHTVPTPVVARNWPNSKKRFAAFVACLDTAGIGFLLGIYDGQVPAMQYALADFGHYTMMGNVVMYGAMALTSLVCWPLPLLHGRKPYTIFALLIALVLQVPQGLAVAGFRDPSTGTYKALLLASRAVSGLALGLSYMNLKAILLDCFGASLRSQVQGSDQFDTFDVRQHGGGMGMWLGFVSWSTIGPISVGFMVGASIIDSGATTSWGFWISMIVLLISLLLNIIAPETREAAFRRTVAEFSGHQGDFSRWGDEVVAGLKLCLRMIMQPGFFILTLYAGWVYAQYSLVLMLLGALLSKDYRYHALWVGLCALSPAVGAIFAAPFQRASFFSRSRSAPARTDSFTMNQHSKWSSHFVRRLLFMLLLPLCGAAYAGSSVGPPLLIAAPCVMAGLVGFFTTMATAECYGLIMETFDTTDLQPGMTGRPIRASADESLAEQRTNFSCYPRVCAGFAIAQSASFLLAAAATAVCGTVQRREGTTWATTGVAVILVSLTLLLVLVLLKWKKVQMVPNGRETAEHIRRANTSWRPVIVGRPSGKFRRLSIFELGRQTRYTQIRQRNRLEGDNLSGGSRLA